MESGECFKSSLLSHSHAHSGSSRPQIGAMPWPSAGTHAGAMSCRWLAGGITRVMQLHVSSFVFPCAPRRQRSLRPNPSFKRSANGRPPGPPCGAEHFSTARAWRPAVAARLTQTLGRKVMNTNCPAFRMRHHGVKSESQFVVCASRSRLWPVVSSWGAPEVALRAGHRSERQGCGH